MSGAGFAGCSESDEQPTAAGTPPVTPSQEVTDFFDAHLSGHSSDFNFSHIDCYETECFLINTVAELKEIIPEPIELPDIDFAKYSAVETGTDVLTLNLIYRVLDGAAPAMITPYYFWGLYDKLPEYEVNVNITTF